MTDPAPTSPRLSNAGFFLRLAVLLVLALGGAFVAWRRSIHPLRVWTKNAQQARGRELVRPFERCFGTATGDGLRRIAQQVQQGTMPAPFKDCHRGAIVELLVAPNALISSMQQTPLELYRLRERERVALQRLTASVRLLERALARAGATPTAEQRAEIARKVEDLVPDVNSERQAFDDLVASADEQAGWF